MLNKIYSQKSTVSILVFAAVICGVSLFFKLPIALFPSASKPVLYVNIQTASTGGEEFYLSFGNEIENSLKGISSVVQLDGEYETGFVQYELTYDWGIDPEFAKSEAQKVLSNYENRFPDEWRKPSYWFGGSEGSMIISTAYSDTYDLATLEMLLKDKLIPKLNQIEGVDSVWFNRLNKKYLKIELNHAQLIQYGLSASAIRGKLKNYEVDKSVGKISLDDGTEYKISMELRENNLNSFKFLVVGQRGGQPIQLRQVAKVRLEPEIPNKFWKSEGRRALMVGLFPSPDANITKVSDRFQEIFKKTVEEISPDIVVKPMLDPSIFIKSAVKNVGIAILIGILTATAVILFFLNSWSTTLIIACSIPLSLIGGFILMFLFGIELNLISLGAMALASGMVVDGAIVVIENIFRHIQLKQCKNSDEKMHAIVGAVREVAAAVITSALTTMVVFLPMMFTAPIAAAILGDLARVMVAVLGVSVLVTLLVIPTLAHVLVPLNFSHDSDENVPLTGFPRLVEFVRRKYESVLRWMMERGARGTAFLCVCGLMVLISCYVMVFNLEREVMPVPDTDKMFLMIKYKKQNYELDVSEKIVDAHEKIIRDEFGEYLKTTISRIRKNRGSVLCYLKDKSRMNEFKKKLEDRFKDTPMLRFFLFPWSPTSLDIPNPPAVEVHFNGGSEDEIRQAQRDVQDEISGVEGKGKVRAFPRTYKEDRLKIKIKGHEVVRLAKSLGGQKLENLISQSLRYSVSEIEAFRLNVDNDEVAIKMGSPKDTIQGPKDIENYLIKVGEQVLPIRAVASVSHKREWGQFLTRDGSRTYGLKIWPQMSYTKSRQDFKSTVMDTIKNSKKINQNFLTYVDSEKEINDNLFSLLTALGLSLLAVLIVINVQFTKLKYTFVILLAVPLGFIGVSASLWLFSTKLSINSMLGLILLGGTAVNNSILLTDFFLQKVKEGMQQSTAVLEAAALRFRPILITTMTTILGMLPIAFKFGEGGEVLQPLGIAVSGGLGVSTLLTLFVIPVVLSKIRLIRT